MPVVREELGPSLPQLLQPRWTALSRGRRIALVVAAMLALALLIVVRGIVRDAPPSDLVAREPVQFNLIHRPELVAPKGAVDGAFTLASAPGARTIERFAVRRLVVPPFKGDISAAYLLMASRKLDELRAADANVRYRGEGKARINVSPGYQLAYQTRITDKLVFGKVFFLVPEPAEGEPQGREGAELTLISQFAKGTTPNLADVGNTYLLKAPLRSFRFGTERP